MQGNGEDQKRNIRRAWLRWAVASVVGSLLAYGCIQIFLTYLLNVSSG